jgi:Bacterial protein of unknown function (DUF924)
MTGGAASGTAAVRPADVLAFWRAAGPDKWFEKSAAFDLDVRRRFFSLWHAARAGELARWEETPEGALALVIALDQFPRNMFRGDRRTYATDELARGVAERAIGRGFDRQVWHPERQFFYLPFSAPTIEVKPLKTIKIAGANRLFSCRTPFVDVAYILVMFQRLPLTGGDSVRHNRDMADNTKSRTLRILTDAEFARLPLGHRALYNHLRRQHGMVPIEEPAVDLSPQPHAPAPKSFEKLSPLAHALIHNEGNANLWRLLQIEMEARLVAHAGDPRIKRAAHRPKRLSRQIAEHTATTLLRVWDRLPSEKRVPQQTVLGWIKNGYGISRTTALELLTRIRERT